MIAARVTDLKQGQYIKGKLTRSRHSKDWQIESSFLILSGVFVSHVSKYRNAMEM